MRCELCGHEEKQILNHLRLMHPDEYEEPERWPDGGLVIEDDTLEPKDFT